MPKSKKEFLTGEKYKVMQLEDHMEPDKAYPLKEICAMVHRTPMRVGYKLKELEEEKKAERRRLDGKIYWMLTAKAYTQGTVKGRRKRVKTRGRPNSLKKLPTLKEFKDGIKQK